MLITQVMHYSTHINTFLLLKEIKQHLRILFSTGCQLTVKILVHIEKKTIYQLLGASVYKDITESSHIIT